MIPRKCDEEGHPLFGEHYFEPADTKPRSYIDVYPAEERKPSIWSRVKSCLTLIVRSLRGKPRKGGNI